VLNYKIGSRCGAAVYETPVVHVAATIVSPPLKGTWNFGSSPDHQGFDAHAWPGQRFSVDFTKLGADGQSIKPDAPDNDNNSFWAYGHDIFAMAPGKVEAAVDANPPNHGRHMLANPLINYILVHHRDSDGPGGDFYHGYYHVFQDGNQVQAGDHVAAGDHIARVGNAGGSSEPHLHIGAIRLDQTGNGTTIPLAYSGLVQDDTKVTVVPGTGQYTS
jgi:hypothetical protein